MGTSGYSREIIKFSVERKLSKDLVDATSTIEDIYEDSQIKNYYVDFNTITNILVATKTILNKNDLTDVSDNDLDYVFKLICENRSSDKLLNIMAAADKLGMNDLANIAIEVWMSKYAIRAPVMSPAQLNSTAVFVLIPGRAYKIGSPPTEIGRYTDEVLHEIELSPFWIMDTAVTQREYAIRTGENPSKFKEQKDCPESFEIIKVKGKKIKVCADYPVENISHYGATRYAELMEKEDPNHSYRLPSEAQLEVAFRGGTITAYVCGEDENKLTEFVWYMANSNKQSHSVRSKSPNGYKVYHSSVSEWTTDWYDQYYLGSLGLDPNGPQFGRERVYRGGSWYDGAKSCRSAYRNFAAPWYRSQDLGFRLIRSKKSISAF